MGSEVENALSKRDFSKVILTLDNVLIPHERIVETPSWHDNLDSTTELDLRIVGCELIQIAGNLLKLPQVAMACGQVLFQRFYYSKSFVKHDMEIVSMACINLASKIEEAPRRIRDVINVFHHVKLVKSEKVISPLILDQNYILRKNQVIKAERRILKELGFCCNVRHPHKLILSYLKILECDRNQKLVQCAWNYMNDTLRTNVFVRYHPETIACACIFLGARLLQIPLPNDPPWYFLFDVTDEHIIDICCAILQLYELPKPNLETLESTVNNIKKLHAEAKLKARGLSSNNNTPNSSSRNGTPSKMSPANQRDNNDSDSSHRTNSSASRSHSHSPLHKKKYNNSRKSRKYSKYSYNKDRHKKRPVSPKNDENHSRSRSRSPNDRIKRKNKERNRSRSKSSDRYDKYKLHISPNINKMKKSHNGLNYPGSRERYKK